VKRNDRSVTDEALVRNARGGDEQAFVQLVKRYEQTVYSFAFKVCRNEDKAAETMQDTFVNMYRKLGQYRSRSKFSTWLYSIVANNCLMKNRRGKLDRALDSIDEHLPVAEHGDAGAGDHALQWKETPLDQAMTSELRDLLDDAVQKLPMDYRTVFVLRDIEGQSASETARILKLSIPAVKSRLRRARVFLREQLDGYMRA
jgi:RNA polymerase sigma-70 factor, ECF subfamily